LQENRHSLQSVSSPQPDARTTLHDLIEDLEPLGIVTFNYDFLLKAHGCISPRPR
jgi:hypothetical protein